MGDIQAREGGPRVWIDSNLPIQSLTLTPQVRPDVVTALRIRLYDSGFVIKLALRPGAEMPARPRLCAWTEDPVYGSHVLGSLTRPDLCPPH